MSKSLKNIITGQDKKKCKKKRKDQFIGDLNSLALGDSYKKKKKKKKDW